MKIEMVGINNIDHVVNQPSVTVDIENTPEVSATATTPVSDNQAPHPLNSLKSLVEKYEKEIKDNPLWTLCESADIKWDAKTQKVEIQIKEQNFIATFKETGWDIIEEQKMGEVMIHAPVDATWHALLSLSITKKFLAEVESTPKLAKEILPKVDASISSNSTAPVKKGPKVKTASPMKRMINIVMIITLVAIAAITDSLNDTKWGSSHTVQLGIKLWLGGLLFHSARETLKGLEGAQRKAVEAGVVVAGALAQIAGNRISGNDRFDLYGPVFAVALGSALTHTFKDVRNFIIPKDAESVTRRQYTILAAGVGSLIVLQSGANRLSGNSLILGSKANADGLNLIIDYAFASAISPLVKGLVRNVDSNWKHYGVIAAVPAFSAISDYAINQEIGEGFVLNCAVAVDHLSKSICYKLIGKSPFKFGATAEKEMTVKEADRALVKAYVFQFFATLGAAVFAKNMTAGSGPSAIGLTTYSRLNRKGRKSVLKLMPSDKKRRLKHVAGLSVTSSIASVLAGSFYPYAAPSDLGMWDKIYGSAYHYFGPTVAVDVTGALTDGIPRAFQVKKDKVIPAFLTKALLASGAELKKTKEIAA